MKEIYKLIYWWSNSLSKKNLTADKNSDRILLNLLVGLVK